MKRLVILALAGLVLGLPGAAHGALRVVTTTQDLAALAEVVGGDAINVESLTPGTRDPHFADAKPSMIRRVNRADLLLLLGADMEIGWLPALIQSARNRDVQPGGQGYLDLSASVALLGKPTGTVTRAMGDVHPKGNPHYWLDPRNGLRMARAIAARLSELDPGNAADYQTRLADFTETLEDKFESWRRQLAALRGRPVIAYHTSFVYLADAFGFEVADEVEPKPGIAPSADYLNQLIGRIKSEDIDLLIMEPYYERRSAAYLNKQTGIRVAVVPQSVGARKGIATYIGLFDAIVAVLIQTMET